MRPRQLFPAIVGHAKDGSRYVGDAAQDKIDMLDIKSPIPHGVVTNWKDYEVLLRHAFDQLGVDPAGQPVLLTEAPANPREHREKAIALCFDTLNAPNTYVSI